MVTAVDVEATLIFNGCGPCSQQPHVFLPLYRNKNGNMQSILNDLNGFAFLFKLEFIWYLNDQLFLNWLYALVVYFIIEVYIFC